MDEKKLDRLGEKLSAMSEKDFDKLINQFADHAIKEDKERKEKEREELGIKAIDLVTKYDTEIIITLPSQILNNTMVNLRGAGVINLPQGEDPIVELDTIPNELFRLSITFETFNYWVDLKDLSELEKAAKFFNVEIKNPLQK